MITNSIAGIQVSPEAMGSIQMIALKVGLGFIELNVDAASSSDPDSSGSRIGDERSGLSLRCVKGG